MAENIKDYGGVEGDDSESACKANVDAIDDASKAADDNTVYLPAGTWYIGSDEIVTGQMLQPGGGTGDRGAAGLGFTGDGPTKSFLTHGRLDEDSNSTIYYKPVDHAGATWDNITYDGRWRHFSANGHDFDADGSQWGMKFDKDASGDITFTNVRFRRFAGNCVYTAGGHDCDLTFDRCTFYDNGIGINQDSGGTTHQHHLAVYADGNSSITATNCEFRLCSGSVANLDGAGDGTGTFTFENCYMEGTGSQCHKITNIGKLTARKIHFISETDELNNEYAGTPTASYIASFVGDAGYENVVEVHDLELDDIAGFGFRVSSDNEIAVRGGSEGPIRMNNVATNTDNLYSEALSGDNGALTFEAPGGGGAFGTDGLSVYNVDGDVAQLAASGGTIDTLHWGNADALGDFGNVSVNTINQGGVEFSPVVPSQSDVGINTGETRHKTDFTEY